MKEDRALLLQDLCARLPYGVIVQTPIGNGHLNEIILSIFDHELGVNIKATERTRFKLEECKPYLRNMSSLTEDELFEMNNIIDKQDKDGYFFIQNPPYYHGIQFQTSDIGCVTIFGLSKVFNYLNSIHIDYLGLIQKGIALEAPEDMYHV